MSVRKRIWATKGVEKTAWIVDYTDGAGVRRQKTFKTKKAADTFAATAHLEVRDGNHVADSASVTVETAGKLWLAARERAGRERTTIDQYRQHLDLHIVPFIGCSKLTALNAPALHAYRDRLHDEGRSVAMIKKVLVSLGSLLADAQDRGLVSRNVVHEMRGRLGASDGRADQRAKTKLRVGVDIPAPSEIKAIVGSLEGRWRPILLTAIFTGLRASELTGLTWPDVDLTKKVLHVRQRADRYKEIGRPKSSAGEREVPLTPIVVNTLRQWKLAGTKSDIGLVFPNLKGEPEALQPIARDGYQRAQVRAGVVVASGKLDAAGKAITQAKYTGLHSIRHFYASWCINSVADGGLGLLPKVVQERLGHSSITMTLDVYGHLFPRGDDSAEMAAAERALLQ